MTYEEQLKVEELNRQIIQNIIDNVGAERFISFYLDHNQKETMNEFGLRTIKQLTKVLKLFNYDFSKPKPSKFKGKSAARNHDSYITAGKKSAATQKEAWKNKTTEEKQAWSAKQKASHSTDSFKAKIKQANKNYIENLSELEKANINTKRSDTMKNHIKNLEEAELSEWINRGFKRYFTDNHYFDSFPELCFYLYHKQQGYNIIRSNKQLEYEYNNERHYYLPDFEIDGQLYEIKGDHLFEKLLQPNTLDNAKYNCMLRNNVIILQSKDYSKYEQWFSEAGLNKDDFKTKP